MHALIDKANLAPKAGLILLCSLFVITFFMGLGSCTTYKSTLASAPKVIVDSDFNTMSDDGQLAVMAVQLQAQRKLHILGITVVSGNQWLAQGVADALASMERLGAGDAIGVYAGANYPMSHTPADVKYEISLKLGGDGYLGALGSPEPKSPQELIAPPDGFAKRTKVNAKDAADFIVQSVKKYPGQVSILAVGPLTNIAKATKEHPEIIPLIKQIIYMGGAVDVAGNTTNTAEFNWWFDPLAVKQVLHLPIKQIVIPLDVTNTVQMDKKIYDRIVNDPQKHTIVTQLFKTLNGWGFDGVNGFETNPKYTTDVWDTLALAYLIDPAFATKTSDRWLDVFSGVGLDNGKSTGYTSPQPGLQRMTVVQRFDNARFFDLYVDLLTRPVPPVNP